MGETKNKINQSEIKTNDGFQQKSTGIATTDDHRYQKRRDLLCQVTQNEDIITDNVPECELHDETADRVPNNGGVTMSTAHLRFPPRLPPLRLQGICSSVRDRHNSDRQASQTTRRIYPLNDVTKNRCDGNKQNIIKKARKQKSELSSADVKEHLLTNLDAEANATKQYLENNSGQHGLYSYNNNGNTDLSHGDGMEDGKSGSQRVDPHDNINDGAQRRRTDAHSPTASLPPPPDHLDDMLKVMINWLSEENPCTNHGPVNSTLSDKTKREHTTLITIPPGFSFSNLQTGAYNGFCSPPGIEPSLQTPLGVAADVVNDQAVELPLGADSSSYSVNAPSGFSQMMRPNVSHESEVSQPPGFHVQNSATPKDLGNKSNASMSNIICTESTFVTSPQADTHGIYEADKGNLNHTQPSYDEDWENEDSWCYEVPWHGGWRETNCDASYLPAALREELHIDISWLNEETPKRPKVVNKSQHVNDRSESSHAQDPTLPHEETSRSNGNNNHKKDTPSHSPKRKSHSKESINPAESPATDPEINETEIEQKESSIKIISSYPYMTRQAKGSSRYTCDVTISSDSSWSRSTVDWGLDIEELLLLLSEPSGKTSEFQSNHLRCSPSICSEQDTNCDLHFLVKHSLRKLLAKSKIKCAGNSVSMFCFTLSNGDLECFDLSSFKDYIHHNGYMHIDDELFNDILTETVVDSLNRYLSEGTWTDKEMDFFRKPAVTGNQDQQQHLHKRRPRSLGICNDRYFNSSLKKASDGLLTYQITGKATQCSTGEITEDQVRQIKDVIEQKTKNKLTYSDHKNTTSSCHTLIKDMIKHTTMNNVLVDYNNCDHNNKSTHSGGHSHEVYSVNSRRNLHQMKTFSSSSESSTPTNQPINVKEITNILCCQSDSSKGPSISHINIGGTTSGYGHKGGVSDVLEIVVAQIADANPPYRVGTSAKAEPTVLTADELQCMKADNLNDEKVHPQQHSKDKQCLLLMIVGNRDDDMLKVGSENVLSTAISSSQETGYIPNGSSSQTISIEEWMRFNDEQIEYAIQIERINGGRPAKQVAPSSNTYQRILSWLKRSDFSLIPADKN